MLAEGGYIDTGDGDDTVLLKANTFCPLAATTFKCDVVTICSSEIQRLTHSFTARSLPMGMLEMTPC